MIDTNFKSLFELVNAFPTEQSCIDHLEKIRWNGNVVSPYDETSVVYKCSNNRYRCKNTHKTFNVKTGTLFESTNIELRKWFMAIWLETSHKKGISSLQLARDINVTQKTAWFMLQRIRKCFGSENDGELKNEVEIDETFVGGKNKNRHANKKVKNSQGRSFKDKTPVIGMLERKGRVVARKITSTAVEHITPEVTKNVHHEAKVITDEWCGYKQVSRIYDHAFVKHNEGEYVNGKIYTNTIEGFWGLLKRGIVGIYHSISRKHLQLYVNEFVFRYNTRHISEYERFKLFLQNMNNRLRYKELVYEW